MGPSRSSSEDPAVDHGHNTVTPSPRRAVLTLLGVLAALVMAIVAVVLSLFVLSWWLALIIGLVAGLAAALFVEFRADTIALGRTESEPADSDRHARLFNVVGGLATTHGFEAPRLYVIPDAAPNALAVGRDEKRASLAVTTGLLSGLRRVELEAVLCRELIRIRRGDTHLDAVVAVLVAGPFAFLPGLVSKVIEHTSGDFRDFEVDLAAVELTRYPPGLLGAYLTLHEQGKRLRSGSPGIAHLWVGEPEERATRNPVHVPLDQRVDALREL